MTETKEMGATYRSNATPAWILYAGVLAALLPVMIWRDFTPDNELRYLSIADEAIRNHDIFAFHNHGLAYADKPPLYFWFLILCRLIAGQHYMWLLSLGSLLPAFGVTAVMNRWCRQYLQESGQDTPSARPNASAFSGNLPGLMLLTCAYFLGASIILRMDMLMCLFIVLSLYTFWKIYSGGGTKRDLWLFPIYLFLALFTKGPLGILIPLCSTAAFLIIKRRAGLMRTVWGWRTWGVLAGLCALWFYGVYADGGKEYLDNLLFHQTVDRAVDSFHHKRPAYYYLTAIWYIMAPWSLYVCGAIIADLRHSRRLPALQQFFITIGLTTLLLLSCISSKLQIYFLPAVPFMVYAAMMSLPEYKGCVLSKIATAFPAAVFAFVLPAVAAAAAMGIGVEYLSWYVWASAAILTAGGITGIAALLRRGVGASIRVTAITMLAALFAGGFALRDLNGQMGYGALCREARAICETEDISDIYVWKIRRPENMDVYLGKNVVIIDEDSVPDPAALGDALLLVRDKDAEQFRPHSITEIPPYAIINLKH